VIPLKAIFVISVLISGLIFSPSYSFAQSNQDDNSLSSFLEFFRQLFSFDDDSEPVTEFRDAVIVQTSGTSSTDTTPNNIAPIANAGLNQTVLEFATVTLDGTSSTDVDGTIVSYLWTQLSGKQVVILSPTNASATFIAPEVSSSGEILEFSLAAVDNSSGTDTDDVKITVNEIVNPPPGGGGSGDDPPVDDEPDEKDGKNKVTICHIPPGNPENAHLITVGEPAVLAHIAHGDTLEECPDDLSGEGLDDNSKKDNQNVKENKGNSGKGNSDKDENEKLNSGKGNNGNDDEDKKDNSGKGNSGVNNSGKGNQNKDKENKSNSKLKNNNDDESKDEDIEHEDEDDDEDE